MNHSDVAAEVERMIRDLMPKLEGQEISEDSTFEDLGMDSLNRVDLLAAAEGHFDIEVPDEEVANFVRVSDLTAFIASLRVG
ncbi:acyl carrier protein [Longispora albida]|uniref:acyl carrier protein n=1 Tax=Longispora albida TaxID=203523 RepID=UPI00035D6713|nr:acyl carrier protein [Longispora albida]